LVGMVAHIRLNGAADSFIWGLHQNGIDDTSFFFLDSGSTKDERSTKQDSP
jgi:hypothetical protein